MGTGNLSGKPDEMLGRGGGGYPRDRLAPIQEGGRVMILLVAFT